MSKRVALHYNRIIYFCPNCNERNVESSRVGRKYVEPDRKIERPHENLIDCIKYLANRVEELEVNKASECREF